jgi:hypothetical protein
LPLLHVGITGLPLLGGAALGQAKRSEEIDGTANQWQPAQVAIEPGGTVTFRIAVARPIRSGPARRRPRTGGSTPPSASPAHHKVGDSCTVTFPEGPAPIRSSARCYAQGMKSVITVGSGGGSGPTTTAGGAGSNVALITTPKAAVPRSAGKPAIY